MLYLTGVNDNILLTCSGAATTGILACWEDEDPNSGQRPVGGRTLMSLSSTDATAIVPANIGKNNFRRIRSISIKPTVGMTVHISASDGTTTIEIFSADLEAGDHLMYEERRGWYVVLASGIPATQDQFTDAA